MSVEKLSPKEVSYIAKLARLDLSQKELANVAHDLVSILDYVALLKRYKVDKVPLTHHATGAKNIFRADEVSRPDTHTKKFLENAPDKLANSLKVKAILGDRE